MRWQRPACGSSLSSAAGLQSACLCSCITFAVFARPFVDDDDRFFDDVFSAMDPPSLDTLQPRLVSKSEAASCWCSLTFESLRRRLRATATRSSIVHTRAERRSPAARQDRRTRSGTEKRSDPSSRGEPPDDLHPSAGADGGRRRAAFGGPRQHGRSRHGVARY